MRALLQLVIVAVLLAQQTQCCCAHDDQAEGTTHALAVAFDESRAAPDHDHHECPREGHSGDHAHHFCLGTHVVFVKASAVDVAVDSPADCPNVAVNPMFVAMSATERLGLDDRFWPPAFVDRAQLGVYHE